MEESWNSKWVLKKITVFLSKPLSKNIKAIRSFCDSLDIIEIAEAVIF
jgi:hypothetical protein